MNLERSKEAGHPLPEEDFNRAQLSDRKKRVARLEDYIIPLEEIEFEAPLPIPPEPSPSKELTELVYPFAPRFMRQYSNSGEKNLLFECEVVVLPDSEGKHMVALQKQAGELIVREVLDETASAELLATIEGKLPEEHLRIMATPADTISESRLVSGREGWQKLTHQARHREAFAVLRHAISQASSGSIRIEVYIHNSILTNRDSLESLERTDVLTPFILECKQEDERFLAVKATLPFDSRFETSDELFQAEFRVSKQDGVILQDDLKVKVEEARSKGVDIEPLGRKYVEDDLERLNGLVNEVWKGVECVTTSREGIRALFIPQGAYRLRAFGQELNRHICNHNCGHGDNFTSFRIFDSAFQQATVRSQNEVDARIYMTIEEAEEYEKWEERAIQKFANEIIPSTKDLTPEQALIYAAEVVTNSVEPLKLLENRFSSGTRLSIIGMTQHPLQDRFPFEVIEQSRNLGIDFVAVHVRNPDDPTRVYKEDRGGLVGIKVKGVGTVEMSHAKAQKKHPEQYKLLFRENREWDGVIAAAREWGLDVLYVEGGDSWRDANQEVVDRIGTHLEQHLDSKGVYFSPLLFSIYWPGGTQEEHHQLGARPFVDVYSLAANAHLSDTSIQMAAYGLRERFPGQVHSMPQFVMPRGFGKEWGHFRQVVNATGIPERFSLDNIAETPFATQRYLFNATPKFGLDELSDQELAEFLVLSDGSFFGSYMSIVGINWGKLIDGAIVYPSDAPLPKTPNPQEFMDAASDYVCDTTKEQLV